MEVKILFPPNKEIADLQATICACAMRSTRTKGSAQELLKQEWHWCEVTDVGIKRELCLRPESKAKCQHRENCIERMLWQAKQMKHWGVFEFADFTVSVSGVSRALTHQLVRHRLFSYLQQSQRAVEIDISKPWYVIPKTIRGTGLERVFEEYMKEIASWYNSFIHDYNVPDEDARFILPNACFTDITISGNARNWLHFFKMRLDPHAQWEIRETATKILEEFMKLSPIIFEGAGELEV